MDLRTKKAGVPADYFWHRAKRDLVKALLTRAGTLQTQAGRKKILVIGVGTGDDLPLIQSYGDIFAIDTEPEVIEGIPQGVCVESKICSACAIDYADNMFDMVVALDVLEHIEDDVTAVKEIYRVLRSKGVVLFTAPAFQTLFNAHDRYMGHFRRYNNRTARSLFEGYTPRMLGYWMFFLLLPVFWSSRFGSKEPRVTYVPLPKWINECFYRIASAELFFIKGGMCPFLGTTIVGIFEKAENEI